MFESIIFSSFISQLFTCTTLTAIAFALFVLATISTFVLLHKIAWIEVLAFIGLAVIFLLGYPFANWFKYTYVVLAYLLAILAIGDFVLQYQIQDIRKSKLETHLKNSMFDYYIQTNAKDKIIDVSTSFIDLTNETFEKMVKKAFLPLLLSNFDILKIDNKKVNQQITDDFCLSYINARNKFNPARFSIDTLEKGKIERYFVIVQPLYLGNYFLGRNIFLTRDRSIVIENLENSLGKCVHDVEETKMQMHFMLSMMDQVLLYYDLHTKTYVATPAFCQLTNNKEQEYSFNQIMDMIHPDDVDSYVRQAENVNSIATTRIKFRLNVNGEYYPMLDDSIYLSKEGGLVSVIRLCMAKPLVTLERGESDAPKTFAQADLDILAEQHPKAKLDEIDYILDTTIGKAHNE